MCGYIGQNLIIGMICCSCRILKVCKRTKRARHANQNHDVEEVEENTSNRPVKVIDVAATYALAKENAMVIKVFDTNIAI